LSISSVPEYFERSQRPALSDAWAWGTLRARREQQRQRVLGGGDDVGLRGVGDDDPALGGGGDVDVVHPDAGPADRLQPARVGQDLGGELGRRADEDAVELADAPGELAVGPVRLDLDVEVPAEQVHAAVADLLGHQDAHQRCSRT
jgi:hypothetical protein